MIIAGNELQHSHVGKLVHVAREAFRVMAEVLSEDNINSTTTNSSTLSKFLKAPMHEAPLNEVPSQDDTSSPIPTTPSISSKEFFDSRSIQISSSCSKLSASDTSSECKADGESNSTCSSDTGDGISVNSREIFESSATPRRMSSWGSSIQVHPEDLPAP